MSRQLSKGQKRLKKAKSTLKRTKKYELQDAKGISRKKFRFIVTSKKYYTIKITLLILIPISYFVYSPLLAFVMIAYFLSYFLSIGYEHSLNKSVIRQNHIRLPKSDHGLALILVVISLFGTLFGQTQGRMGRFSNTITMKIWMGFQNFGSLLTGNRQLFGLRMFRFGLKERPHGFIPNGGSFNEMQGQMPPPMGFENRRPPMNFDLNNVPIEFMFSQILSTVTTLLIVVTWILGILSLYTVYRKIKRFNTVMIDANIDGKIILMDDDAMLKILDFGEIEYDT